MCSSRLHPLPGVIKISFIIFTRSVLQDTGWYLLFMYYQAAIVAMFFCNTITRQIYMPQNYYYGSKTKDWTVGLWENR